ncbi:MAG: 50S ribosomal protein L10 [Patescibacteria group bacterium]|nr:50S ribosomal protein L10 [Patescibacteria group bacterium]MDE2438572.1 50S ribosomal protein L10 [Patescibacteria group bacterium]
MALTRKEKESIVQELSKKVRDNRVAILGGYSKLPFSDLQNLRRALKEKKISSKTAKKTLLNLALGTQGLSNQELFEGDGSVMLTLGSGDEVAHAKTIFDFSKKLEGFSILGGFIDHEFYSGERILALAQLPSKEVLLSQFVYAAGYPLRGLVGVLQGNMRNLVSVLHNIQDKKA